MLGKYINNSIRRYTTSRTFALSTTIIPRCACSGHQIQWRHIVYDIRLSVVETLISQAVKLCLLSNASDSKLGRHVFFSTISQSMVVDKLTSWTQRELLFSVGYAHNNNRNHLLTRSNSENLTLLGAIPRGEIHQSLLFHHPPISATPNRIQLDILYNIFTLTVYGLSILETTALNVAKSEGAKILKFDARILHSDRWRG